jgi:hypothetical protein
VQQSIGGYSFSSLRNGGDSTCHGWGDGLGARSVNVGGCGITLDEQRRWPKWCG